MKSRHHLCLFRKFTLFYGFGILDILFLFLFLFVLFFFFFFFAADGPIGSEYGWTRSSKSGRTGQSFEPDAGPAEG